MALNIKQITNLTVAGKGANINIDSRPYVEVNFNPAVVNFGYNCEPKGIEYPIYINNKKFEIGKTQILEADNVEITKIAFPQHIRFTFDYTI